eukprot:SAG11_NODE_1740_length_4338_cov_2.608634_1_plen_28_part_10
MEFMVLQLILLFISESVQHPPPPPPPPG